jgi:hypothetical protein
MITLKILVYEFTTLDGVIDAPDVDVRLPPVVRSRSRCTPTTAVTSATHPTPGARSPS